MSLKIPDPQVPKDNAKFVQNLTGKEHVGLDAKGRLYVVKDALKSLEFLSDSKVFQPAIHQRIGEALQDFWKTKNVKLITEQKVFYDKLIDNLSKMELLSADNQILLVKGFYEQRYQTLIGKGNPVFVAESMVTIEMSQDPHVSESVKTLIRPKLTDSGVNGTYITKDRLGNNIGVFKPMDEEAYMPNSPRENMAMEYDPENIRRDARLGHLQGSGWQKEVAAWMIDRGNIAGIPETVVLSIPFPKRLGAQDALLKQGSLQQFVSGIAIEGFSDKELCKLPARQIQQLAVLDLIIGNADRNWGNVFWNETTQKVIPIDHGFSLLDSLEWREDNLKPESEMNCHWYLLPQLAQPLPEDLGLKVHALNSDQLAVKLRALKLPEGSIRELKIRLMVFQKALKNGYNLAEITLMLMPIERKCLVDEWSAETIQKCQQFKGQWNTLSKELAERKQFKVYFELLQKHVDNALRKNYV